jgi:UDP-N-acetylglucosamine 1-carboxyvinyltransferase
MQECLKVQGQIQLAGCVTISGAKNAALPILAATLLSETKVSLENIPNLQDIAAMLGLLADLGTDITFCDNELIRLDNSSITRHLVPFGLVKKMRASVLVLGPLLARFKAAVIALPGGCAIGARPIDIHLYGLKKMGVTLTEATGYVYANVDGKLKGADINCHTVSVTATENLMMAATLAEGKTRIYNAACEPEVVDLGRFLLSIGAKIKGLGTRLVEIEGVEKLGMPRGNEYRIIPDRIEAGTYLVASALTKGVIHLKRVCTEHLSSVIFALKKAGVDKIKCKNDEIVCDATEVELKAVDIKTEIYPGFPTDMQAQFMSLNLVANGDSKILESIFENRFMHAPELTQLGGQIEVNGQVANVKGGACLMGAPVYATDLRASASLVLAALAACGETTIHEIYHMDRGYCQMEIKLSQLGAKVKRVVA